MEESIDVLVAFLVWNILEPDEVAECSLSERYKPVLLVHFVQVRVLLFL